jgi:hypothetical protein
MHSVSVWQQVYVTIFDQMIVYFFQDSGRVLLTVKDIDAKLECQTKHKYKCI